MLAKDRSFSDLLLKRVEIAELLGISETAIHSWIKNGDISFENKEKKYYGYESIRFVLDRRRNKFKINSKIQVFANIKGGVGKSTLASQYAMLSSLRGLKVLAIDLDAQAHLTDQLFRHEKKDFKTIYDVFIDNEPIKNVIQPVSKTLDIIPSSLKNGLFELTKPKNGFVFEEYLSSVKNNYDLIIMDTNPTISQLNRGACLASDLITIISSTDYNSYSGLEIMLNFIVDISKSCGLKKKTVIVPNLYDIRDGKCSRSLGAMHDNYNQFLTNSIVRKNTTLSDASEVKNSIYLIKKNSHGSQDIIQLTDELYTK
tara:strand:- start:280 stop:1221 length:942 start_codon:yes stop_codon:yes gene_type:complete